MPCPSLSPTPCVPPLLLPQPFTHVGLRRWSGSLGYVCGIRIATYIHAFTCTYISSFFAQLPIWGTPSQELSLCMLSRTQFVRLRIFIRFWMLSVSTKSVAHVSTHAKVASVYAPKGCVSQAPKKRSVLLSLPPPRPQENPQILPPPCPPAQPCPSHEVVWGGRGGVWFLINLA
jgi:hypothetical protein